MTEDLDSKDSQSDSGSKTFVNKSKDKKAKTHRPLTKIILRRLPPTMTEEAFLEQVSPIPEHDHFYFARPDTSLGNNIFSRAYINFVNVDDIYLFRDKFDGYVFLDEKGLEYVGIVEYAPFQRVPKKKKKKDPKCGTIESDPVYQEFLDNLNKDQEIDNQPKLEYSYPIGDGQDKKAQSTPLLEYLASRKQDKRSRDERRRRENDKRKMRIERKTKDGFIRRYGDLSEDDANNDTYVYHNYKQYQNHWLSDRKAYNKNKSTPTVHPTDLKCLHGSEELISTNSDWDSHFPALATKTHNTFTLSSAKLCSKKDIQGGIQRSGGDTYLKEEDEIIDTDIKKVKPREWERDKLSVDLRDEQVTLDGKDGAVFESKSYKDQRKPSTSAIVDKKKKVELDKKDGAFKLDDVDQADDERGFKKDKRDKFKESPREQKSKKYSDTRKERIKQTECAKNEKLAVISKIMSLDSKPKSLNHDDIKPFTQLPQVKTDDLVKIIESMDKKVKLEENHVDTKTIKITNDDTVKPSTSKTDRKPDSVSVAACSSKVRRESVESDDTSVSEDLELRRQKSIDERAKSIEREGSEEKDKIEGSDRRTERRIRNKDRPSLPIYQPGMGKFSKQRIAKEKDSAPSASTARSVSDSEKRDT